LARSAESVNADDAVRGGGGRASADRGRAPRQTVARGPGARGIIQMGRNPDCGTLTTYRLLQIEPVAVASAALGTPVFDEGSNLALSAGTGFESVLLRNDAAMLREVLTAGGHLPAEGARVVVLDDEIPGKGADVIAARERRTREYLAAAAAGAPDAPDVLWHGRLRLRLPTPTTGVALPSIGLEPDLLLLDRATGLYRIGESKSFRFRGPRTEPDALAGAQQQAAVGWMALRAAYRDLRRRDLAERLPRRALLVLRKSRGMGPHLVERVIAGDIERLSRVLRHAIQRLPEALAGLPSALAVDAPDAIPFLGTHFVEGCRDHCPLVRLCETRARQAGDPTVLGDAAAAWMGPLTLHRARALLDGAAAPATPDEVHVLEGLNLALRLAQGAGAQGAHRQPGALRRAS
jgi:hypothetical protein